MTTATTMTGILKCSAEGKIRLAEMEEIVGTSARWAVTSACRAGWFRRVPLSEPPGKVGYEITPKGKLALSSGASCVGDFPMSNLYGELSRFAKSGTPMSAAHMHRAEELGWIADGHLTPKGEDAVNSGGGKEEIGAGRITQKRVVLILCDGVPRSASEILDALGKSEGGKQGTRDMLAVKNTIRNVLSRRFIEPCEGDRYRVTRRGAYAVGMPFLSKATPISEGEKPGAEISAVERLTDAVVGCKGVTADEIPHILGMDERGAKAVVGTAMRLGYVTWYRTDDEKSLRPTKKGREHMGKRKSEML